MLLNVNAIKKFKTLGKHLGHGWLQRLIVIRAISNQRMFIKEQNHISATYFPWLGCFGSEDEAIVQNTGLFSGFFQVVMFIADRICSDYVMKSKYSW